MVVERRPRLRFPFQEIDLPPGATLIGRDVDCHVTLDDPLVSRRHARILVGTDRVLLEDLGSRNGVYVNGLGLREPQALRDGDRLRIGAAQLVFCEVERGRSERPLPVPPLPARPTGELGFCRGCGAPYALELVSCPGCESARPVDVDTLVGDVTQGSSSGACS